MIINYIDVLLHAFAEPRSCGDNANLPRSAVCSDTSKTPVFEYGDFA